MCLTVGGAQRNPRLQCTTLPRARDADSAMKDGQCSARRVHTHDLPRVALRFTRGY